MIIIREEGYGGNNIVEEWGGNHWEQVLYTVDLYFSEVWDNN